MKTVLVILLLAFAPSALGVGEVVEDSDCVATALATADPSNSVGEAISNAIAQAFSRVVACDAGGEEKDEGEVGASSLAVSVAVAIASSETAGAECVAETDAVAEVVSDLVTQGVAGGLLENTDPVQQTLAEAWLAEETSAIATRLQEGADGFLGGPKSCGLVGLQKSLSTAQDVGAAMEDAITQILLAVSCGINLEAEDPEGIIPTTTEEQVVGEGGQTEGGTEEGVDSEEVADCRYDSAKRKFFGPCFPAKMKRRNCNREFRDCKKGGREIKVCHRELKDCSDARLTQVVRKGPKPKRDAEQKEERKDGQQGGGKKDGQQGGNRGDRQEGGRGGRGGKGGGNGGGGRGDGNGRRGRRFRLQ
ncbi:hypothetical protein BSKO_10694 [Bryopsis sp. KO-2023]|nr:hypothetical protein BSKO_10694 [Bryopsis sp. KO-2023]